MKCTTLFVSILISINSFGQAEYFEFNNPNVINITEESIDKLTSVVWYGMYIFDYGRHDTTLTKISGTQLIYYTNNSYTFNDCDSANWTIEKDRYIVHTIADSINSSQMPIFGGIFGIIELNDSMLHLVKLQTSTHDMQRHIIFSSKLQHIASHENLNRIVKDSTHENANTIYGAIYIDDPTPEQLDSISNLSTEELFFNEVNPINDSILIHTLDSVFKVKWEKY